MKAIRKFDGQIIEVEKAVIGYCEVNVANINGFPMQNFYSEKDLDFNLPEEKESAVIEGWVAVDDFGNTCIYHSKPTSVTKEFCDTGDLYSDWDCETEYPNGKKCYIIDDDFFPDLIPESEPRKIRIQITPME